MRNARRPAVAGGPIKVESLAAPPGAGGRGPAGFMTRPKQFWNRRTGRLDILIGGAQQQIGARQVDPASWEQATQYVDLGRDPLQAQGVK